jgi:uncharacterized protein (TIGR02996 family)
LEIAVTIALLFAVPVGLIIYSVVAGPNPWEQLEAMLRDPKQRARAIGIRLQVFRVRRPPSTVPIPRPAPPIAELAHDRSEEQLLADLRTEPRDYATRMVYADWLEQRDETVKANFLRQQLVEREVLMSMTDIAWRAVVSHAKVPEHSCESLRWHELQAVADDPLVRACPYCTQLVRYCNNVDDQCAARARDELAIVDGDARF